MGQKSRFHLPDVFIALLGEFSMNWDYDLKFHILAHTYIPWSLLVISFLSRFVRFVISPVSVSVFSSCSLVFMFPTDMSMMLSE